MPCMKCGVGLHLQADKWFETMLDCPEMTAGRKLLCKECIKLCPGFPIQREVVVNTIDPVPAVDIVETPDPDVFAVLFGVEE